MDIADMIVKTYFLAIGTFGFYLLWQDWRRMRKNTEEHKRRIRERADEYMEERER